jgi:hypothetical protein
VKVLSHPQSDFNLGLSVGKRVSSAKGLSVLSVDVSAMMLQYWYFIQENLSLLHDQASVSIPKFVGQIVLPNLLRSHVDGVVMNRLRNLFYGAPMSQRLTYSRVAAVSSHEQLDRVLQEVIKKTTDTGRYYFQTLTLLPALVAASQDEHLLMPELARTRQVWWVLLLTRLSDCKFLIDLQGAKGLAANGMYLGRLKNDLFRLQNEASLKSILSESLSSEIYAQIKTIQDLLPA